MNAGNQTARSRRETRRRRFSSKLIRVAVTEAAQRKAASLKRLVDRLRSSAEWVWGNKLVEWLVDCSGPAFGEERSARYDGARQMVFTGVKSGEFVTPNVRPHLVHQGGPSRFLASCVWWRSNAGDRDRRKNAGLCGPPSFAGPRASGIPQEPLVACSASAEMACISRTADPAVADGSVAHAKPAVVIAQAHGAETPSTSPSNTRGPRGVKLEAVTKAMVSAVRAGRISLNDLSRAEAKAVGGSLQ